MHPEKKRIKSMFRRHEILEVSAVTILPVPSRKIKWLTLSRDLQSKESCKYIFTSGMVLFLFLRYQSTLKDTCFDLCMCVPGYLYEHHKYEVPAEARRGC